jgi:hypothetical protein
MARKPNRFKSVYSRFPPPKYKVGDWVRYYISPQYPRLVQLIGYDGPSVKYGHHYRYRHIDEFGQVRESGLSESDIVPAEPPDPLPVPAPTPTY